MTARFRTRPPRHGLAVCDICKCEYQAHSALQKFCSQDCRRVEHARRDRERARTRYKAATRQVHPDGTSTPVEHEDTLPGKVRAVTRVQR
jgi:hypothetical protein